MEYEYKEGQYVMYRNVDTYEIGKIKSLRHNGAMVYFSGGETAAFTSYYLLKPIMNDYVIKETILGGRKWKGK